MKSNRTRAGWGRRPPTADDTLRESVLRVTARNPKSWGFVLARMRAARRLTLVEQSAELGASESAVVFLSLCHLPRPSSRDEDLATASALVGISVEALLGVLAAGSDPTPAVEPACG